MQGLINIVLGISGVICALEAVEFIVCLFRRDPKKFFSDTISSSKEAYIILLIVGLLGLYAGFGAPLVRKIRRSNADLSQQPGGQYFYYADVTLEDGTYDDAIAVINKNVDDGYSDPEEETSGTPYYELEEIVVNGETLNCNDSLIGDDGGDFVYEDNGEDHDGKLTISSQQATLPDKQAKTNQSTEDKVINNVLDGFATVGAILLIIKSAAILLKPREDEPSEV